MFINTFYPYDPMKQKRHSEVFDKVDAVQARLLKIAEYQKPYGDILKDIRKRHYRKIHRQKLADLPEQRKNIDNIFQVTFILWIISISALGLYIISEPLGYTGHAVQEYVQEGKAWDWSAFKEDWSNFFFTLKDAGVAAASSFITMALVGCILLAMFFGRAEKNYHVKHDDFKHPDVRYQRKK